MRHMYFKPILALLVFLFITAHTSAQQTFIHCGRLIDVRSGKVQETMTIIVDKNKILDVQ